MTEKETFLSIEEAHQKYDIPGRSNREFIYDKDGMIRIYKVGQKYIDDVIENNKLLHSLVILLNSNLSDPLLILNLNNQ